MRRSIQIVLVPFWLVGFLAGIVVVVMLAVWHASRAGYVDITSWVERLSNVKTD